MKQTADLQPIAQQKSRYPFTPFPRGWFLVGTSDEIVPGDVRPWHFFGRDLVVYRSHSGHLRLMDAHCPHLGAHLGHGGRVEGEKLRCPFHGWCWDGNGEAVEIPYSQKIPRQARARVWPVVEQDGYILAYCDQVSPSGNDTPTPPSLPAWRREPGWTPTYRQTWRIRTHPQEMLENFFDMGHFITVHDCLSLPTCRVDWAGEVFYATINSDVSAPLLHHEQQVLPMTATVENRGIGVTLFVLEQAACTQRQLIFYTPIDGEYVDVNMFVSSKILEGVENMAIFEEISKRGMNAGLQKDIDIWTHKAYLARPTLCADDGPIGSFRRWARQFYAPATTTAHSVSEACVAAD